MGRAAPGRSREQWAQAEPQRQQDPRYGLRSRTATPQVCQQSSAHLCLLLITARPLCLHGHHPCRVSIQPPLSLTRWPFTLSFLLTSWSGVSCCSPGPQLTSYFLQHLFLPGSPRAWSRATSCRGAHFSRSPSSLHIHAHNCFSMSECSRAAGRLQRWISHNNSFDRFDSRI